MFINFWYAAERSEKVTNDEPTHVRMLGLDTTDITQLKSNSQTPSWHSCGKPSRGNGEYSVTRCQTISAS